MIQRKRNRDALTMKREKKKKRGGRGGGKD